MHPHKVGFLYGSQSFSRLAHRLLGTCAGRLRPRRLSTWPPGKGEMEGNVMSGHLDYEINKELGEC
ncbi:MAG: hypothetical protein KKD85_02850, partial [Proteobacteria bacterium]|nr:hypothetical protein [Pseudomonadota bacterium]